MKGYINILVARKIMAHRNASLLGASIIERDYTERDALDDTLLQTIIQNLYVELEA